MKITVDMKMLDLKGHADKIENDHAFWTYAATEWHRLYSPYVPHDSGLLRSTVEIRPHEIEHTVPYAHYQYEGIARGSGKSLKYRDPKASAHWDQAAAATQMPKLVQSLQTYIDSGRIKLD